MSKSPLERWRKHPIEFIERVLINPETGKPFTLLPAEKIFIEHAFKINPDTARLLYSELVFAAPKKSGKTAWAGMLTLVTVLLFGGAYPEAIIAANDLDQSLGRVFEAIKRVVEKSPLLKREAKITADRISFPELGATITAIPNDYAGAAGGNANIAVFDELWGYTSERSRRLWDELIPPPTRKIACRLTVTYAGFSGESTLLEELYKRGMALPLVGPDLRAGDGMLFFWATEPIAPWQDDAWLADMRRSLRPNAYLRMIGNQFVSTESSFIDMAWWDACIDPQLIPLISDRNLKVYVGIDASIKHDSTGIVATAWDKAAQQVRMVYHRIFQPSPDNPLDFEETVEHTILDIDRRFNVRAVYYDPYQMHSVATRLVKANIKMMEFPQSVPSLTQASQNLYELIKGRNLKIYHDEQVRRAISQAIAIESPRGWRIAKDKQSHKIDVVVALAMSALAAITTEPRKGRSWSGSYGYGGGPITAWDNETGELIMLNGVDLRDNGRRDDAGIVSVIRDELGNVISQSRVR